MFIIIMMKNVHAVNTSKEINKISHERIIVNSPEYNIYECVRMMQHFILLYSTYQTFERFTKQIVSNYIFLPLLFGARLRRRVRQYISSLCCREFTKRVSMLSYIRISIQYIFVYRYNHSYVLKQVHTMYDNGELLKRNALTEQINANTNNHGVSDFF